MIIKGVDNQIIDYTDPTKKIIVNGGVATSGVPIECADAPTTANALTNRTYVDASISALPSVNQLINVRVATTAELASGATLIVPATQTITATVNGALVVDGVTMANGDRLLDKDETNTNANGVYVVTDKGSVSTPWILTRATDLNETSEAVSDVWCFVEQGTANANKGYKISTAPTTLDTDPLLWTQFSGTGTSTTDTSHVLKAGDVMTGALGMNGNDVCTAFMSSDGKTTYMARNASEAYFRTNYTSSGTTPGNDSTTDIMMHFAANSGGNVNVGVGDSTEPTVGSPAPTLVSIPSPFNTAVDYSNGGYGAASSCGGYGYGTILNLGTDLFDFEMKLKFPYIDAQAATADAKRWMSFYGQPSPTGTDDYWHVAGYINANKTMTIYFSFRNNALSPYVGYDYHITTPVLNAGTVYTFRHERYLDGGLGYQVQNMYWDGAKKTKTYGNGDQTRDQYAFAPGSSSGVAIYGSTQGFWNKYQMGEFRLRKDATTIADQIQGATSYTLATQPYGVDTGITSIKNIIKATDTSADNYNVIIGDDTGEASETKIYGAVKIQAELVPPVSAPGSPNTGSMYVDAVANRVYFWNGSAWKYAALT